MKEPVKQHIVPKAYLKNFSIPGEEGFVYAFKIKAKYPDIKIKKRSVSSICYINDFYTIATKEPLQKRSLTDRYIIEKQAFPYENKIKGLVEKIEKEKRLNSLEANLLVKIVLDIKKRNKVMSDFYNDESNLRKSLENQLLQARFGLSFHKSKFKEEGIDIDTILDNVEKTVLKQFQDEGYRLDLYREGFLDNIEGKGFDENLIKLLSNKKFFVFKTTPDYPFITSDNPGWTLTNEERHANVSFGNWAIFSFPLSPEMLLVILNKEHDFDAHGITKNIHFINVSKEIVDYENFATVVNSIEMIISNNMDTLVDLQNRYRHHFFSPDV